MILNGKWTVLDTMIQKEGMKIIHLVLQKRVKKIASRVRILYEISKLICWFLVKTNVPLMFASFPVNRLKHKIFINLKGAVGYFIDSIDNFYILLASSICYIKCTPFFAYP